MPVKRMTVTALAILIGMHPAVASAGPLLESAKRLATEMTPIVAVQPMGCSEATAAGQELADRREGSAGYLVGGIFIPVIMPLIGMVSNPAPPASEIRNIDSDDLACFQEGYRDRGRSKKVRGGWIGSGIGIGLYVVLVAAAASQSGY
jgi:hypothetical protein